MFHVITGNWNNRDQISFKWKAIWNYVLWHTSLTENDAEIDIGPLSRSAWPLFFGYRSI